MNHQHYEQQHQPDPAVSAPSSDPTATTPPRDGHQAMRIMQRLHGHSDGLVSRPRLYEYGAAIGFLGRRRRVYDDLIARSGAQPGDHILDIGCGTGYLSRRAARAVTPDGTVVGIDPSPPVIDYATRRAPANCTFQLASAQTLPYPDASFDVVISSLAIHHLPPDERPIALREAYRVLRPGGRLLIADIRRRPRHTRVANPTMAGQVARVRHRPPDPLAVLMSHAGFHVTGSGDRRPWLYYVQAQRPAIGAGSELRADPHAADHQGEDDNHGGRQGLRAPTARQ